MCVIVGFTQKTRGREEVLACLDRAYTRGPDMARVAETASGWLGFRRLSIMGLDERGMQPFALGPDQVVCNGELYGWRRQRAELEQRGYTFRSGSDCELLLPMYREYGLDMFARLDAEFALILYDGEADEYVAARDPIGIRPLFYGCDPDGGILFASEAKQLVGLCEQILPFPPGHYWYRDGLSATPTPPVPASAGPTTWTPSARTSMTSLSPRWTSGWTPMPPWAFFSLADWTPAWCVPSPPGCLESLSAPSLSAWTPTPSI